MEVMLRWSSTCLRYLGWLCTILFINSVAFLAEADTVTATVTATILPTEPAQDGLRIQPGSIELNKGENARLVITNESGQTQNIHIHVSPVQQSICHLTVSPKRVLLYSGALQVFRLFYTPADEGNCNTVFTLHVDVGSDRKKTIQVKCE